MNCKTCGNTLKEAQKFCSRCGTSTAAPAEPQVEQTDNASDDSISPVAEETTDHVNEMPENGITENEPVPTAKKPEAQSSTEGEEKIVDESVPEAIEPQVPTHSTENSQNPNVASIEANDLDVSDDQISETEKVSEVAEPERDDLEITTPVEDHVEDTPPLTEIALDTPLPDNILLLIRTELLEHGVLGETFLSDLFLRTRAAGIVDERTNYHVEQEVSKFGRPPETEEVVLSESQNSDKRKRWIIPLVLLLVIILICFGTYLFRASVLNTLDSFGLTTTSMRDWLNVPGKAADSQEDGPLPKDTVRISPATNEFDGIDESLETPIEELEEVPETIVSKADEAEPQNHSITPKSERQYQSKPKTKTLPPQPGFYTIVDDMPKYPGGNAALLKFIAENTVYPKAAKMSGISGVVYVDYIVSQSGEIEKVRVVKGVHSLLDKEAVRVISSLKGYSAGKNGGKAVPVKFTIPVRFVLN